MVTAFPRTPHFKGDIIQAVYEGIRHKLDTTFGSAKVDVLVDKKHNFRPAISVALVEIRRGNGKKNGSR